MNSKKSFVGSIACLAILAVTLLVTGIPAAAQRETVLHSFGNGQDGSEPSAGVIFDAAGNLYGTTPYGGTGMNCSALGCGTAFELTPAGGGKWTEKVLHDFDNNGKDGYYPNVSLTIDPKGNLFGGTPSGGYDLRGLVFELTPLSDGNWSEEVLHNFNLNATEGYYSSSLISDADGNLYGTACAGGTYGVGTAFQLTHHATAGWMERILYTFSNKGIDGYCPSNSPLMFDAAGNLYGTTLYGGNVCSGLGCGTVFELTPKLGGGLTEKILHNFSNIRDGVDPTSGVIMDAFGNLYGTTVGGGENGVGTVFKLSREANGAWKEKVLYSFNYYNPKEGFNPYSGLVFDRAGNLYGTTLSGGMYGYGTVYELIPALAGGWTERVLHSFAPDGSDGINPVSGLTFDTSGNLYGTTPFGGAYGNGTVFEITP